MNWEQLLCEERPRESTFKSADDHRTQFERDFDRTVFSTPVKRLQDKAQVFPLEPHDAVRTRLTHSLEVSSVARGLAIDVGKWLCEKKEINQEARRKIEAIAATCGLIHDLGNPPFGHSGEDAIRYWFKNNMGECTLRKLLTYKEQLVQDFLKFEGNAQSLRLVTKLQILADYHGLNLTWGTLSASCKYISNSMDTEKDGDHAKSKPGFFASEKAIISDMQSKTGTNEARNPITYLVEAADDIVYAAADIEDAVKKGILEWSWISEELKSNPDKHIRSALEGMENILKPAEDRDALADDVYASAFRTSAIKVLVEAVTEAFEAQYDQIMSGTFNGELVKECKAALLIEKLKEIGRTKVYCTPSNLKLEIMGRRVICDLMDLFWEGAKQLDPDKGKSLSTKTFWGKINSLISDNYRRVFYIAIERNAEKTASEKLPETYFRLQLVTDYICGMTDTFAKRLHSELTNG